MRGMSAESWGHQPFSIKLPLNRSEDPAVVDWIAAPLSRPACRAGWAGRARASRTSTREVEHIDPMTANVKWVGRMPPRSPQSLPAWRSSCSNGVGSANSSSTVRRARWRRPRAHLAHQRRRARPRPGRSGCPARCPRSPRWRRRHRSGRPPRAGRRTAAAGRARARASAGRCRRRGDQHRLAVEHARLEHVEERLEQPGVRRREHRRDDDQPVAPRTGFDRAGQLAGREPGQQLVGELVRQVAELDVVTSTVLQRLHRRRP